MASNTQHSCNGQSEVKDGIITGYCVLWNSLSNEILTDGFYHREIILPYATSDLLRSKPKIVALLDHKSEYCLGSTTDNTLTLTEDKRGLHYSIKLPNTSYVRDLVTAMEANPLTYGASFHMGKLTERWSIASGGKLRTISKIGRMLEITITALPAYPRTTAAVKVSPVKPTEMAEAEWAKLKPTLATVAKVKADIVKTTQDTDAQYEAEYQRRMKQISDIMKGTK